MKLREQLTINRTTFTSPEEADASIRRLVRERDGAAMQPLGLSEEGREIYVVRMGSGSLNISLLAGAHSDEPVGPETLRTFLIQLLDNPEQQGFEDLLNRYTFHIIPHINPDGESVNWPWIKQWPDLEAYIEHAFRESPGRDLEFGYPNMRVENRLISSYLRDHGPFHLHMSLHGMAFSEGLMLLIERHWIDRTESLQASFRKWAESHDFPLHDHDRGGEKGFQYIGPGISTTPEGRAMQQYFKEKNDPNTASKFHLSSMELVRTLGGDPLCLVTELPLYIVNLKNPDPESTQPGHPRAYLALKEKIPQLRKRRSDGQPFDDLLEPFEFTALPLSTALEIQFKTLEQALELVRDVHSA